MELCICHVMYCIVFLVVQHVHYHCDDSMYSRSYTHCVHNVIDGTASTGALLSLTSKNSLALLSIVTAKGHVVPAGRSYGGGTWEGVVPLNLQFDCSAKVACRILSSTVRVAGVKSTGTVKYQLKVHTDIANVTASQSLSRFLMQATWGQSVEDIEAISKLAKTPEESMQKWLNTQITMKPTQQRAWFRARVNQPIDMQGSHMRGSPTGKDSSPTSYYEIGEARKPCQNGSRWHTFSFIAADEGSSIRVSKIKSGCVLSRVGQYLIAKSRGLTVP
jgi:hypothetical protein